MKTSSIVVLSILAFATASYARSPGDAPALSAVKGTVVTVSNVEEIYRALRRLKSNTTIVLRKGNYQLHRPIHIAGERRNNITIRGETDRYEDVIIRGAGMNNKAVYHGILAENVERLTIANVTIGWVGFHPIALNPKCDKVHVYHCRFVDAGEQFIKASSDGKGGGVDDGIVEYSVIEYMKTGPANGYTNGVDVHGGKNWVIRHNLFRNIRTPAGAQYKAVPAVLMWNGAKNTVCEANTFINCDRAIAYGLVQRKGFPDHEGGIIRNNFIYADKRQVKHLDTGIFVASRRTKVLHNTILLNGGYPYAIETRWRTTGGVEVVNNLTDARIVNRDGAQMINTGNSTNAQTRLFESSATGDLHLVGGPVRAKPHSACLKDWDDGKRPSGRVTVGADEYRVTRNSAKK